MAEARCAQNRLVLPRLKWHSCFCSTLCAVNMRLDPTLYSVALPLGLALQAVLRFVDESPLPKELLLSRREYEHHAATDTPDISVGEAHKPSSILWKSRWNQTSSPTRGEMFNDAHFRNYFLNLKSFCLPWESRGEG